MPQTVDSVPGGSGVANLPWEEVVDGAIWMFTPEEIASLGVQLETVRVAAHKVAADGGRKFGTKTHEGNLYIWNKSNA